MTALGLLRMQGSKALGVTSVIYLLLWSFTHRGILFSLARLRTYPAQRPPPSPPIPLTRPLTVNHGYNCTRHHDQPCTPSP